MKTNEKVSQGTAIPDRDTSEINQLQYEPDFGNCQYPVDPVIPELIAITKRTHELRSKGVIFDVNSQDLRVHIPGNKFPDLFGFGEWEGESHGPEFDKYSTNVQGVEFFCLVEKGPEKCTAQ